MTRRAGVVVLGAALALLLTGCPEDLEPEGPAIVNGTDEDIFVRTTRAVGAEGSATRVVPGQFTRVTSGGGVCISGDALVITDGNPDEPPDDAVLLRHDLDEQPLCADERWVFDGERLTRER